MKLIYLLIIVLGLVGAGSPLLAMGRKPKTPLPPLKFSAWIVYWDDTGGQRALASQGREFEEISIFAYHFDAIGSLVPANEKVPTIPDWIKQNLPQPPRPDSSPGASSTSSPYTRSVSGRLLMTVVNDVAVSSTTRLKDAASVHQAIAAPAARAAHIQQLLALSQGLDGIDIDYERLDAGDREAFSEFIKDLGQALHARKQWLSVVVEPRPGAIDWAAIVPYVDRIQIMAYLYHYGSSGPGSIAPTDWVVELADAALETIPAEKLGVVLHVGGFDWPEKGPGHSIEYAQAALLATTHNTSIRLDKDSDSGYFEYRDQDVLHHVWIEEAAGLMSKIRALQELGIGNIGFWRLGTGDPDFWDKLESLRKQGHE